MSTTDFYSTDYEESFSPTGYDDTLRYTWGPDFNMDEFKRSRDRFNKGESLMLERYLIYAGYTTYRAPLRRRSLCSLFRNGIVVTIECMAV